MHHFLYKTDLLHVAQPQSNTKITETQSEERNQKTSVKSENISRMGFLIIQREQRHLNDTLHVDPYNSFSNFKLSSPSQNESTLCGNEREPLPIVNEYVKLAVGLVSVICVSWLKTTQLDFFSSALNKPLG